VIPTARTIDNTRFFQFIKWENVINTENTLQLQYYYNFSDKEDRYSSEPLPADPFDTFILDVNADIQTERHNLELTHFIDPSDELNLVWGASAQIDYVQSPLYLVSDDKVKHDQFRLFANIEWYINQSNIINLGGLLEKNDFSDTELSPRFSFTHAFSRHHRVRAGISRAIRSPFVYEALGELSYSQALTVGGTETGLTLLENVIRGNQGLANEEITSHELVYMGEFINSSLLFNARLFYDNLNGYIDTLKEEDTNTDPTIILYDDVVHVFRNPIDSTTTGLELELDYHIDPSLRLITTGAIVNISSNSDAISLSAPQHSLSLFLNKRFNEKYEGSLAYYYVDAFKWTDARPSAADPYSTDEYNALDVRVSRNFSTRQTNGSLSLVIKNLFDEYSDYLKQPSNSTAPIVIQNTTAYIDFRLNF
jgi:iron complex outermembrane receptor protein